MSEFSTAITRLIDRHGGNTAIVRISGLGDSVISRLASNEVRPKVETVRKICAGLSDQEAADLLLAYLRDAVPDGCSHLITLAPADKKLKEDSSSYGGASIFNRLGGSVRTALLHLAEMCMKDPDFAKWLVKHVDFLDPQWAESRVNALLATRPNPYSPTATHMGTDEPWRG
jgi:hypothetical protein